MVVRFVPTTNASAPSEDSRDAVASETHQMLGSWPVYRDTLLTADLSECTGSAESAESAEFSQSEVGHAESSYLQSDAIAPVIDFSAKLRARSRAYSPENSGPDEQESVEIEKNAVPQTDMSDSVSNTADFENTIFDQEESTQPVVTSDARLTSLVKGSGVVTVLRMKNSEQGSFGTSLLHGVSSSGGDEETTEDTRDVSEAPTFEEAYADGVRLLARKAKSSGELRRDLLAQNHEAFVVEDVICQFMENLYLDDEGLARVLTESLRDRKRLSTTQIRAKLRERLLPQDIIELVLSELDDEQEIELLTQTANDRAQRLTGLDRVVAERRLLGFLARRGWSGQQAQRIAREALDNTARRGTVRFR